MSKRTETPLKFTEFAPIDEDDEKQSTVGQYISNFFSKFSRTTITTPSTASSTNSLTTATDDLISNDNDNKNTDTTSDNVSIGALSEGRSLPSVMKRISNLLATKNTSLQAYSDTELRQYWMPDSVAKECFECSEKFTTWRRRHHCRLCGQIFCSRCCSQEIPGKLMGCTGDLRVCMYCCKVVLSYLPTSNYGGDISDDIQVLLENLQSKYGTSINLSNNYDYNNALSTMSSLHPSSSSSNLSVTGNDASESSATNAGSNGSGSGSRRKISVGYQEEKFAIGKPANKISAITEERCRALQSSTSLRVIYEDIIANTLTPSGNTLQSTNQLSNSDRKLLLMSHRIKFKNYNHCFPGSQLVDWLINHNQAKSRVQAAVIGQALLEAGYLEVVLDSPCSISAVNLSFSDSLTNFYRPCPPSDLPFDLPPFQNNSEMKINEKPRNEPAEPTWVQQIPHDGGTTTDSEAESQPMLTTGTRIPSSSSSFYLDLDVEASTVHLVRPFSNISDSETVLTPGDITVDSSKEMPMLQSSGQQETPPEFGWYNAKQLREENGEADAYRLLNEAWQRHETALVAQFLNNESLPLSWSSIVLPLVSQVIDFVRPDMYHNADIIDIREYVRIKTVAGATRQESCVIRGIVCTKNVVHKCMQGVKLNPKILLLTCPLIYQRNEGKYMALEPVLLQEYEYLRHATSRILAMKPNIVLVARNASRLAQELLGKAGVALATNVKTSVIDRLARASGADVVMSIDAANLGRLSWRLATCQEFSTKKFIENEYSSKTLMFFEGLPASHLACTVILRGASKLELKKLKKVVSKMIFARYNWRLEQSFLMDEFAKPPAPANDNSFFDSTTGGDSKDNSPIHSHNINDDHISIKCNNSDIDHNCNRECNKDIEITISQQSKRPCSITTDVTNDPLQCFQDDDISDNSSSSVQQFLVKEISLSNRFRKALDDTILSYSPFLTFTIPFLETETGRHCKLRKFFPKDIYYSSQFADNVDDNLLVHRKHSSNTIDKNCNKINENIYKNNVQHEFITSKLITNIASDEVQTMLAQFRACGGQLKHKQFIDANQMLKQDMKIPEESTTNDMLDVLSLENHQRLAVLFCSFSTESPNAPAFCVDPCTKEMHFYGVMDAALGNFLEQYCFRDSYRCISENCTTSMLKHTRRYVHHNGCVTLKLNYLEQPISSGDRIVMWNWCTKCNTVSPVAPMSTDTWSFSFAKFLEFKVHGYMYGRRGKDEVCTHSLHHDHVHYFGYGNIAASFQYTSVELLELSLPSPFIEINYNNLLHHDVYIEEMKQLALKGHEIYSTILEKILELPTDLPEINELKQLLHKNQSIFKSKIEEIQIKLTSPTIEHSKQNKDECDVLIQAFYHLEDSLVIIKRLIFEACEVWNVRLLEIIQKSQKNKYYKAQDVPLNRSSLAAPVFDDTVADVSGDDDNLAADYNAIDVANESIDSIETVEDSSKIESFTNSSFEEQQQDEHHHTGASSSDHTTSLQSADDVFLTESRQSQSTPVHPLEKDKKTVKTLITQLLSSSAATTLLNCPFNPVEHHLLPLERSIPLIVYENEPSSIIAYALTTYDYKRSLDDLGRCKSARSSLSSNQKTELNSSPVNRRKLQNEDDSEENGSDNKARQSNSQSSQHIDVQFHDNKTNFMVRIHYAEQFSNLRRLVLTKNNSNNKKDENQIINDNEFEQYEQIYIRSMSRSVQWTARGGKSGSFFCKTKDDRFILKEMSSQEMEKFFTFAPNYFDYMTNCLTMSRPTLLGKIIGVYRVCYKNASNGEKKNFLVMENLFYERRVTHKFDLKGSVRNRHVNADNEDDSEIVLLDENLLKMTCKSPLYIYPHSKTILTTAIINDTEFLAAQSVMDYSLLVGLDPHTKELVVGIIDYIRTFTWDKKIETIVKKSGLLGGQGKLPTIISPDEYKNRFILAMHRYFLPVPGRWYGLNIK